ncbi:MAG: SDR family NAD(P)-dependent oxidoreductase [Erysipelotrichales bacterium]|nr:SDR family NAD(P)-dependent oxidoreductase [Erysipelotrichales bacterium]
MRIENNTILITGGATGIGYAIAKWFLERNNKVIICGRRTEKLELAKKELKEIEIFKCDVTDSKERVNLFNYISENFPDLNILINNAGIQRDIDLSRGILELEAGESELKVNLEAPIYLSALFTPFLKGKDNATIVNVSSGLAFRAEFATGMPIYCATKAALHAFSLAQRKQLEPHGIKVVELIPPAVVSELNMEGRKKRGVGFSMPSSEDYVNSALAKMAVGEVEIRGI